MRESGKRQTIAERDRELLLVVCAAVQDGARTHLQEKMEKYSVENGHEGYREGGGTKSVYRNMSW